jgi:hypothetical protein
MELPTIMTGGFSKTNQGLWQLVTGRAACPAGGLSPEHWYPVSVPAGAARREAAAAIAVCEGCRH